MFQNYTVAGKTYKFCVQSCSAPNILLNEHTDSANTLCLAASDIDQDKVYVAKPDQKNADLYFLFTCENYFSSNPKESLSDIFKGKLQIVDSEFSCQDSCYERK